MRYVIELYRTADTVYGCVTREDTAAAQCFHGWLELVALLEPPPESTPENDDSTPNS